MKRKSPILHRVHTHKRNVSDGSVTVTEYMRGHGERKAKLSKPRIGKAGGNKVAGFNVVLTYSDKPNESYPVSASSYPEAIENALLARSHISPPKSVEAYRR